MKINSKTNYLILFFIIYLVSVTIVSAQQTLKNNFAFEQNEKLGRGVNILGYDPLWKDPSKARMNEKHFKLIKEAGFNNVRIVLSPFRFSMNDTDFTINPFFFTTLDWTIKESLKNKLMVIVDFHEHNAMQKDPLVTKPMFLAMWNYKCGTPRCQCNKSADNLHKKFIENLIGYMEKIPELGAKLSTLWYSGDYHEKQKLQNLLFPEGIIYNRKMMSVEP